MACLLPFSQCQFRYVGGLKRWAFTPTLTMSWYMGPVLTGHLDYKKMIREFSFQIECSIRDQ